MNQAARNVVARAVSLLAFAGAFGLLVAGIAALLPGFSHGIDISDEGLYLVAADAPAANYTYVGLWGDYLHPLYAGSRHDITTYRALGAVLLAVAALICARGLRYLLISWGTVPVSVGRSTRLRFGLDLVALAAALVYYALYLITPSYNWLTLVGLLLCAGGLLPILGSARGRWRDRRDAALVAGGVFVTFMGRPTAGAGLAALVSAVLLAVSVRPIRARLISVAVVAAVGVALIMLHLVFVLGWADTVNAFTETNYFVTNDSTTHGLGALLRQSLAQFALVPSGIVRVAGLTPWLGLLALAGVLVPTKWRTVRPTVVSGLTLTSVVVVTLVIQRNDGFGGGPKAWRSLPFAGLAIIMTAGLALVAASTVTWWTARCETDDTSAADEAGAASHEQLRWLGVGAFFLGCALLYAFSSNNGIVYQMHGAFVLLALSALALSIGAVERRAVVAAIVIFALVSGVAAVSAVNQGAAFGYRTAAPSQSTERVVVSHRGASLLVGPAFADFYRQLAAAARVNGFAAGTPLVDLSPFSPGIGYALGAEPPTTLMLGFSPGVARWALAKQDLTRWHDAWLLVAATGTRRIDPTLVVGALGRSFPADYELVSSLFWPTGNQTFELWRPRPS